MMGKPAKIMALASLGVLVIAGWQSVAAKDKKEKSSAKPVLSKAAAAMRWVLPTLNSASVPNVMSVPFMVPM